MISRYQTKELARIWSDENRFRQWFIVELAYLDAYLKNSKKLDLKLMENLWLKVDSIDWVKFAKRVSDIEVLVKHDVIAFLSALEEELGEDSRLIHVGLTSSDVVDTAFGGLLKLAGENLLLSLENLIDVLWDKAQEYRGVYCLGRTHGQAAEPTTFGIKLLGHMCEFARGHEYLSQAIKNISVGKFSGAVGVYAYTDPLVEEQALKYLGLSSETVATQVVCRDRHANFFCALATIAGSIERLATEVRLLMHVQVSEAFEAFSAGQKGSSAMPHKKNPILSENLCGLMRLVRSYSLSAMENQALWHERDISHSSVERVIAPDATSLMAFAFERLNNIIKNLIIDKSCMQKNLLAAGDKLYSQGVMLALVKKNLMRQKAYELVQQASFMVNHELNFKDALINAGVLEFLRPDELEQILNAKNMLRHEDQLFKRADAKRPKF